MKNSDEEGTASTSKTSKPKKKIEIVEEESKHRRGRSSKTRFNIETVVKNEVQQQFVGYIHDAQANHLRWNIMMISLLILFQALFVFEGVYYLEDQIRCKIPELEDANWTHRQKLHLSAPYPNRYGYIIGCYYYNYSNYRQLAKMPYKNAMRETKKSKEEIRIAPCDEYIIDHFRDPLLEFYNLCNSRNRYIFLHFIMYGCFANVVLLVPIGIIADIYGRKLQLIITYIMTVVGCILLPLSFDKYMVIVAKTITFFSIQSSFYVCFVILVENSSPRIRPFIALTSFVGGPIGYILLLTLAKLIGHWRYIYCCTPILLIPIGVFIVLIPESPRWLMCYRRWAKARKALHAMDFKKAVSIAEIDKPFPPLRVQQILKSCFSPCERAMRFIRSSYLFLITIHTQSSTQVYTVRYLGFYKSMQLSCFITAGLTFIAVTITIFWLYVQRSRRLIISSLYLLTAFFFITSTVVQFSEISRMIFLFCALGLCHCTSCVILLKTAEVAPTVYRTTHQNFKISVNCLAFSISFLVFREDILLQYTWWLILGLLQLSGSIVCLFLSESKALLADYPLELVHTLEALDEF